MHLVHHLALCLSFPKGTIFCLAGAALRALTRGCITTGHGDYQHTDPGRDVHCCPHHHNPNTKRSGATAELAALSGSSPSPDRCRGLGSTHARLRPGGAGTCCLNVNTSFIHLDWLSSAMLRYT